jgi:Zn-dependent metalloprotease
VIGSGLDALGVNRSFSCSLNSTHSYLFCDRANISTFDYRQVIDSDHYQPRIHIQNPPTWDNTGVSAHANTLEVERFLRDELEHLGLDNNGLSYNSFVQLDQDDAFWYPGINRNIFVYGTNSDTTITYAAGISIVAHEIFHGVTHFTSRLEGRFESGALNESYSDIFGVILNNQNEPNINNWEWEIGIPSTSGSAGVPIRSLSDPERYGHPNHMNNYNNDSRDRGGIHSNNGIHNHAAYRLLISRDSQNNYLFNSSSAGLLFYLALTNLNPKSNFSDSKRALILYASECFQGGDQLNNIVSAINTSFDSVGII